MAKSFALSMASMHSFDEALTEEVDLLLKMLADFLELDASED